MIDLISQQWPIIIVLFGGVAALVAFGDKLLSFLLKFRDLRAVGHTKVINEEEIDFLRSFIRIIDDDLLLNNTIKDILERHAEEQTREVRSLKTHGDWNKILQIRMRVREYFEYSSQYKKAVEFGKAYEAALKATGDELESYWVRVKDVGYMLIMDEEYKQGRDEILSVLGEINESSTDEDTTKLRFYAYRYIGISFLRSKKPDTRSAEESFRTAREIIHTNGISNFQELEARIEGNFGNLQLQFGCVDKALSHFYESLSPFRTSR